MATIEVRGYHPTPAGRGMLHLLAAGWRALARRRQERRALAAAARLDSRLLRDIGFEPEQIAAALGRGWDRTDPTGLQMLMPKHDRV